MLKAVKTPSVWISQPKRFLRIREVCDGVLSLDLGRRRRDYRSILEVSSLHTTGLYTTETHNRLLMRFQEFLKGLSFPIQIVVRNLPYDLSTYTQRFEHVQGAGAEIAHDHVAFVSHLTSAQSFPVHRAFYIIVPADYSSAEKSSAAQQQINERVEEIQERLNQLGLTGVLLSDNEIIDLYQRFFRLPVQTPQSGILDSEPVEDETQRQSRRRTKKKRRRKNSASQSGFTDVPELLFDNGIRVFPWYMQIEHETSQEYIRTLSFVNYPQNAGPGWFRSIIEMNEPYVDFSLHIVPLESSEADHQLDAKAQELRHTLASAQRWGKTADPNSVVALQDLERLRKNLEHGDERVLDISLFVLVRAHERHELNERHVRVASAVHERDCRLLPTHWQQHAGFLACLPEAANPLRRGQLFSTSAASTFYPFAQGERTGQNSVMFGMRTDTDLVLFDPFQQEVQTNANLVALGARGTGKSFFLKVMASRMLPIHPVYIVDSTGEYQGLCDRVGGNTVYCTSHSLPINPFELSAQPPTASGSPKGITGKQVQYFREKLLHLVTVCELLLAAQGELSLQEKAFLYRCLVKTYDLYGITADPATFTNRAPKMRDLYMVMSSAARKDWRFDVGKDSTGLSERLKPYVHLFPSHTNVPLEKQAVAFNLSGLSDTARPAAILIITEFLWSRVYQQQIAGIPLRNTLLFLDEVQALMRIPYGAKSLVELTKKLNACQVGLWYSTRTVSDMLQSEDGRALLELTSMKLLLRQEAGTVDAVARHLHINAKLAVLLHKVERGEGLLFSSDWVPLTLAASPKEVELATSEDVDLVVKNTSLVLTAALTQQQQQSKTNTSASKQVKLKDTEPITDEKVALQRLERRRE